MAQYRATLDEQETTINVYPAQIQQQAEVYSCIPATMRKLRKLAAENPDEVLIEKDDGLGIFAQVPARWIQIRKPRRVQLTAEKKAEAASRLAAARAKQGGGEIR